MQKYPLASLKVSRLGLGGNIFGRFTDEKQTLSVFNEAKNCGINFVDTADVYSDGSSENLIGKSIKGNRDYWVVATKIGIPADGITSGLGKKEKIITSCESSLKRLQTDTIDLYQMHPYDPDTPIGETLEAMQILKKQGKIKEFGISNYTVDDLFRFRKTILDFPDLKCASLQVPYNALARGAEERLIPFCMKERIAVLPYNVLARGILTEKYLDKIIPENSRAKLSESVRSGLVPEVINKVKSLKNIANFNEITLSQLILSWTLAQRGITAIPLGMRNPEQVKDNSKATEIHLSPKAFEQIEEIIHNIGRFTHYHLTSEIATLPKKNLISSPEFGL